MALSLAEQIVTLLADSGASEQEQRAALGVAMELAPIETRSDEAEEAGATSPTQ
jgi:hypothetical protein